MTFQYKLCFSCRDATLLIFCWKCKHIHSLESSYRKKRVSSSKRTVLKKLMISCVCANQKGSRLRNRSRSSTLVMMNMTSRDVLFQKISAMWIKFHQIGFQKRNIRKCDLNLKSIHWINYQFPSTLINTHISRLLKI